MRGLRILASLCLLLLMQATSARADLIITIGSTEIKPGGTASVPVFIRSDTGTDVLDNFSLQFVLTPAVPAPTVPVTFTAPQSDSQLTDSAYLLFGNSQAATFGSFTVIGPPTAYFSGDGVLTAPVPVPSADTLLAWLDLTAGAGTPGGQYQISLVNTGFTVFNDASLAPIDFTSTPGTVAVVSD